MTCISPSPFEGWEIYPSNIVSAPDEFVARKCNARLSEDAERLFIPADNVCELRLLYAKADCPQLHDVHVKDANELLEHIDGCSTRVLQMRQPYSWSQLLVTEETFRKLATLFSISPRFLEVIHTFGEKIAPVDESFGSCDIAGRCPVSSSTNVSYEISYNFKYVGLHRRSSLKDPYSIRQIGVHQRYDAAADVSTWILVHPPDELWALFSSTLSTPHLRPADQFRCHAVIFRCLLSGYRDCINTVEENMRGLMDQGYMANLTRPSGSDRNGTVDVEFADIRKLQILKDRLQELLHTIAVDLNLCRRFQRFGSQANGQISVETNTAFKDFDDELENCICQLNAHHLQLESIAKRAENVGIMIYHILAFRSDISNRNINSAMHELSKKSVQESRFVRRLTSRSTEDTRSMKVIAIVSSVFLPATFIATFFGSNFFGFHEGPEGNMIAIASNIWIYVIATVGISGITIAIWYWWLGKGRPLRKETYDIELMPIP